MLFQNPILFDELKILKSSENHDLNTSKEYALSVIETKDSF